MAGWNHPGHLAGSYDWPYTRIRRRGWEGYRNLRKRGFLKDASRYIALLFLFVLAYVWSRVEVIETGYRLRDLDTEKERLLEENRALTVEAATLRSPQRLAEVAAQLGLREPAENEVYFVSATGNSP